MSAPAMLTDDVLDEMSRSAIYDHAVEFAMWEGHGCAYTVALAERIADGAVEHPDNVWADIEDDATRAWALARDRRGMAGR